VGAHALLVLEYVSGCDLCGYGAGPGNSLEDTFPCNICNIVIIWL
jgi:hypothetical protein